MDDGNKSSDDKKETSFTDSNQNDKKVEEDGKEGSKQTLEPIPFLQLFRFTTTGDRVTLLIAIVAALVGSAVFPVSNIVFGSVTELMVKRELGDIECNGSSPSFVTQSPSTEPSNPELFDDMVKLSIYMIGLGVIQLVTGYLFVSMFNRVAEKMVFRLRKLYLEALLRQDIGWYDTVQDRNFVSKVSEDIGKVQEAVGEKVGLCVFYFLNSIISLVIALYYGWLLTLVVLSSTPVIAAAAAIVSSFQSRMAVKEQKAYGKSGSMAQEVLANIKTVMAFSGQGKEMERYQKGLVFAVSAGKYRGFVSAIGNGVLWFLNYLSYALAFWYGTKLILDGERTYCEKEPAYTSATLFIVFFCILIGSFNVGQSLSYLEVFAIGRGAAAAIYKVIDRVPPIDSYADTGINPTGRLSGKIEFLNVKFSYPSRQDVQVLQGLSIKIKPGSTVAFVGNSGCGKSTCLQLLQRFYDPDSGTVTVDGNNIKDYNINWYRSQLGVVSQEPILFNTTIAENIRYGRDGVSNKEIEEACRLANAHLFISRLPQKYETKVGDRGAQLSGVRAQVGEDPTEEDDYYSSESGAEESDVSRRKSAAPEDDICEIKESPAFVDKDKESMLQQELAWYDDSENAVGALCSRLSGDAASIQGATGGRLGIVVQSLTTLAVSSCLSLYVMPRLGAVALAFAPLILIATYYNGKIMEGQQIKEKSATEEASKLAFQAVSNIRTVASLCKERKFVNMYCDALVKPHKKAVTHSHLLGCVWGFAQGMLFVAYGVVLYYGAILIRDENLDYKKIFVIGEALVWSMLMLGNTLAFAPNYNKAKVAGGRILSLLNKKPIIVNSPGVGLQIRNCQGSVIFDKTEFHYPTRPEVQILKGLTLGIEPTLNIGICGPSGSGKSTCVQLILRYYDPTLGRVLLDETDVGALNVDALRSQMAIVSQEPALFDRTMADNIAYGDNSRSVDMSEIIEAARSANIHDFISSLPAGYSTKALTKIWNMQGSDNRQSTSK
ncbi:unnamed protein product [Allacma fusca]|uniref:Uncharacterized protein n=1 Tax=Allacma fusca TaxID=39272 RepID=A0A8J2KCW1_9HEXA|nr:unnamed protein product [Allacma fusca]